MKTLFRVLTGVLLYFYSVNATASIWRSKKPMVINSDLYNVYLSDTLVRTDILIITVRFDLVCSVAGYSNFESKGGHFSTENTYAGKLNNNRSGQRNPQVYTKLYNYLGRNDQILKYDYLYPYYTDQQIKIILFNGNNSENIEIDFIKISSSLFPVNFQEINPYMYIDEQQINGLVELSRRNNGTEKEIEQIRMRFPKNFEPAIGNNIQGTDFPNNLPLRQLLQNNTEFDFELNMKFYFEILHFRMIPYIFNESHIKSLLKYYDRNYPKYSNNEFQIGKKIQGCINILREAGKKINWGEIFYKDYEIQLDKYDFDNKRFTVLNYKSSDHYLTKTIHQEASWFRFNEFFGIYWANWISLNRLQISESEAEKLLQKIGGNSRRVKLRTYFLLQPISVYDDYGYFQGITAFGLKSILFNKCVNEELAVIQNKTIPLIANGTVKKCYSNALNFLNTSAESESKLYSIEKSPFQTADMLNLGSYSQNHSESCETGHFVLSASVKKEISEQRVLTFYLQTNYYYSIQNGNEVIFYNSNTGHTFPLVISTVSRQMTSGYPSILVFSVNATRKTIEEMLKAKVNAINIQALGKPKYNISGGGPISNIGKTIQTKLNYLGIQYNSEPIAINKFLNAGL